MNKKFKVYQGVGLSKKVVAEVETRKEAKQMAHKLQENNTWWNLQLRYVS